MRTRIKPLDVETALTGSFFAGNGYWITVLFYQGQRKIFSGLSWVFADTLGQALSVLEQYAVTMGFKEDHYTYIFPKGWVARPPHTWTQAMTRSGQRVPGLYFDSVIRV